jgi:hypothetical protein
MNASYAAELWIQYFEPLRAQHGIRLGAPGKHLSLHALVRSGLTVASYLLSRHQR